MANDNKILIEVELSGNGPDQTIKLTEAFAALKDSVNSLSKPLNSMANDFNNINKTLAKDNAPRLVEV